MWSFSLLCFFFLPDQSHQVGAGLRREGHAVVEGLSLELPVLPPELLHHRLPRPQLKLAAAAAAVGRVEERILVKKVSL